MGLWRTRLERIGRRLLHDDRGMADYVGLAIAAPLAIMVFVGGSTILESTSAQAALHTAAGIADRSMVADGCLTSTALNAVDSTLKAANMNPSFVSFNGTSNGRAYGTTGINVGLTYNLGLTFPGTHWHLANTKITSQVSGDQSQYVPYDGATSSCASTDQVNADFSGNSYGSGSIGSTVSLPSEPTTITESVTPTTDQVGSPVTISGVVSDSAGPMAGVDVAINLGAQGETHVTSNSSGQYSATMTPDATGSVPVGVTAGPATNTVTLTVVAASPAAITLTVPPSVTVDEEFAISGMVTTENGSPVTNGTVVTVSASGSAFTAQTADTVGGAFTIDIPGGIGQAGTYTITATAGSVSTSQTLTVTAGAPQSVTLSASPTTVTAGSAVSLSGVVEGPDGTSPVTGTGVTIASPTDSQDAFPVLSTNSAGDFSGSVTLTVAGSQTLTATAGTAQSSPITVTVTPGAPAQFADLSATPGAVNQGAITIIEGQLLDAYGNPEPTNTSVTLTSSAWSSSITTDTTSDGDFAAPVTFDHSGDQTVTLTSGSASATVSVEVNAQGAYTIQAAQSTTSLTAGQTASVTWTLTDSQGQAVAGKTLTFSATPSSGTTLSESSGVTNSAGQVTMTVATTQAGTLEVAASADGVTGTAVWTVSSGAPAILADPSMNPSVAQSTNDGGTVDPTLTGLLEDAYGNPIAGASLSLTGGWDSGTTVTGTTASNGTFALSVTPVTVGGPYTPSLTASDAQGSKTFTPSSATLTVVKQLYTLVLSPTNGSASTPAGTPYGITATLTAAGNAPVANAHITFTVPSGDTATTWSSDTSSPTPSGPTSITGTTNSNGQVTVEAAFEPGTGNQTVQATFSTDAVTADLSVSVGANQPSTVTWTTPDPDPVTAGSSFVTQGTLIDSYGFPVAAGEQVTVAFASDSNQTWTTRAGGLIGYASPSDAQQWFTPTKAGTWDVVIFAVDGTQYNQSGDPTLPDVAETVDPGPIEYFWPVLANTSDQWEPGMSWGNGANASQGPTNAYGTLNIDTPSNGQPFALAGIGYDAYGNAVDSGAATASVSCSASNGGTCPSLPGSVNGSYANTGGFTAGSYTLNFTPTGSPYPSGVSSSPTTTSITFSLLGLRGWNVQVGDGSTTLGSGGPGSTIALGTLPSGVNTLNFSIEGLDQNGNVFTGYTNNGTDQEGVICVSATNGGVCPGGSSGSSNVWLSNTIPLGSSGSPDGYTGWSNLTTFTPGTYTLSIWAGQYGDVGGQNWPPTWANTDVTFTVTQPPDITSVGITWATASWLSSDQWTPELTFYGTGLDSVSASDNSAYDTVTNSGGATNAGGTTAITASSTFGSVDVTNPYETSANTWVIGGDTPWLTLTISGAGDTMGNSGNINALLYGTWSATNVTVELSPWDFSGSQYNYGSDWTATITNAQGQSSTCVFTLPSSFYSGNYENSAYSATLSCS